jgi:ABC-type spermidine/putrescine transport system permease subunit II
VIHAARRSRRPGDPCRAPGRFGSGLTIFTGGGVKTLPIWIFQSFRLANQVPLVNVAGVVAILLSVIPVYIATRISSGVAPVR